MPAYSGILVSDAELANLEAYLATLGSARSRGPDR
jgi:hypothetical protein